MGAYIKNDSIIGKGWVTEFIKEKGWDESKLINK
jgi:hypothetical protein